MKAEGKSLNLGRRAALTFKRDAASSAECGGEKEGK